MTQIKLHLTNLFFRFMALSNQVFVSTFIGVLLRASGIPLLFVAQCMNKRHDINNGLFV